ncbi:glycosyltransferase family 4 protein [Actibacterium sp. 188UL27-1]|uniref:glycosyltransferase family 4 protein n=1 Tax=Actibacterium sp. 188UL27-1 TaxID=2786961 RepID=UPI00195EBEF2|nr:glycosyltransferase family 4 protein [Actibacterium sp. 188UL27-1]MBM7069271.1 glycosyltransferase family 4 protein [Actibacterium sp. 188UL27-1]
MTTTAVPDGYFAIPGDMYRKTGGFIYERTLLETLQALGLDIRHLQLPAGFADPTPAEMTQAIADLVALPADRPVIVDGLVYGAIDPAGLDQVRAPLIAMIHHPLGLEAGLPPERAAFLLRNEAQALARAAHVVVPSPHTAQTLIDDFGVPGDKITIALPGFIRPTGTAQPQSPPLILSVGLLAERKGHDVLLEALAQVADLDWCAQIVGGAHDPQVAQSLLVQRDDLGLQDRVAFIGTLDSDALEARYRAATLFALATRYEGYGMVFGEAMTHGLPIVSCRAGAVPDTVPAGTGRLVSVDAAPEFAAALREILTQSDTRQAMAAASGKAGAALPSWQDTARIMAAVLAQHGATPLQAGQSRPLG